MSIKFSQPWARLLEFGGRDPFTNIEYLGIGAHADDLETLAWPGIEPGLGRNDRNFFGVVINTGVRRPRAPAYDSLPDKGMYDLRLGEQVDAGTLAEYRGVAMLAHPSCDEGVRNEALVEELAAVLLRCKPRVVFTHNPFDTHSTHRRDLRHVIWALESIRHQFQPEALFGGRVWGAVEWIPERYLFRFDCSTNLELQWRLLACFKSQNQIKGKGYDVSVLALRRQSALLHEPREEHGMVAAHWYVRLDAVMRGELSLVGLVNTCFEERRQEFMGYYTKHD